MTKKILLVLAIVLSFTTSLVFAETNDMISNAGNSVRNVVSDIGNTMMNDRTQMGTNNNGDYSATRTAATANVNSGNTLTWTWFILAVATIIIVGLVWYYGTQNEKRTNSNTNQH